MCLPRKSQAFDGRIIPWVTFTDPELARVGMTEADLQESKIKYNLGRMDFKKLDRAVTTDQTCRERKKTWQAQMAKYSAGISGARMRAFRLRR